VEDERVMIIAWLLIAFTACAVLGAWILTEHRDCQAYYARLREADAKFLFSAATPDEWRARQAMIERLNGWRS
jgi:hypothetical protein